MAKEQHIVDKTIAMLRTIPGSFVRKNHGGYYQQAGIPDIYFTCEAISGHSVWIELKKPGQEPTKKQRHTLGVLTKAGCTAFWADNIRDVCETLREIGVPFPTTTKGEQ